ncbi:hypothetical protein N665_1642s0006 [Sinapis alba]|nr:hypothetical protein N665_1642s0006 [Sinapis alba]
MDHRREDTSTLTLPERMFAIGDEPIGVRVTPYHKPFAISKILRALEEDEIDLLRRSQFGRLLEIAEKLTFSGRFGRYLMSRQLRVRKKHEAWFLFAGKPKRAKKQISEKPYWGELFGTLKDVPVTFVVKMLKKKEVVEKETRVKYALLAILASVILPTTHTPRISHEHAEKIKELDVFMGFPWGRLSFDLLMTSIKERNEVSLSQNTIALKGFVLALQLVMVEVVPALTEVVREGGSSDSEGDFAEDEDVGDELCQGKRSISPGHARETDCAGKAVVVSIISVENTDLSGDSEFQWSDEEEDIGVDNLVQKIEEGYQFSHSSFVGGASKADVSRMREESRNEAEIRKTTKQKSNLTTIDAVSVDYVATTIKARLTEDITRLELQVKNVAELFSNFQTVIVTNIQEMFNKFQGDILKMITPPVMIPSDPSTEPVVDQEPVLSSDNYNTVAATIPMNGANIIHTDVSNVGIEKSTPQTVVRSCHVSCPLINTSTVVDAAHIIENAMRFVDNAGVEISNDHTDGVTVTRNNDLSPTQSCIKRFQCQILDPSLLFPKPTFSLGLTQEDPNKGITCGEDAVDGSKATDGHTLQAVQAEPDAPGQPCRKSKRQKVLPRALVGDYQCDKTFLTRAWEAYVRGNQTGDNIDYAEKFSKLIEMLDNPFSFNVNGVKVDSKDLSVLLDKSTQVPAKVVDVLTHHIRSVYNSHTDHLPPTLSTFLDTKFVSALSKNYTRFSKTVKKDNFKFPTSLCESLFAASSYMEAFRFYFPFNFDKKHWVGVCIDTTNWQLVVLDCNTCIRTDALLSKELRLVAIMFPYVLRQAGKLIGVKEMKAFAIERPRTVPQNQNQIESAVTAVLLIQAHSFGGLDVCKCITPNVLEGHVQRAAVKIVEENHGII